ncbi:uncharacterized protein E0L32_002435 [Thyridium curvatum]|uniref:Uncharacterized protein n=1 Tax=Thyridium curvatum TaxID=1093900 RepID=A0A507BP53_9PEZI|nr:uncharacterized protein E0L32_002435 [Thyridium curvatum]TPX18578.1 hypothetical protein E0L32_002435 [Thyridium curvatum]
MMKWFPVLVTGVTLANASPLAALIERDTGCNANNCLRAVRGAPADYANMFCTAALGKSPATSDITVTATSTVTALETATSVSTEHITTTTTATITGAPNAGNVQKRKTSAYSDYTSHFSSQCSYSTAKLSSACSCYLANGTTSTLTVYTTVSATFTEATITTTTATTTTVQETASATTSICIPAQTNALRNGDFEQDTATGAPWQVVGASDGASHEVITDAAGGDATHVFHSVLRHPANAGPYTGQVFQQAVGTCVGTKYRVQYSARNVGDSSDGYSYIYINGNVISTVRGPLSAYTTYYADFTATTETTTVGIGSLQVFYTSGEYFFDNVSLMPAPVVN